MNEEGSNQDKTQMRDVEQVVLACAVECVRVWKYYEFAIASRGEGAAELYYPKLQHAEESLQTAVADMLAATVSALVIGYAAYAKIQNGGAAMKVHCETCDNMVPADDVHSCFDAARVTQHREAERAVIKAAKAMANKIPISTSYSEWLVVRDGLVAAVATLRKLEGA